MMGVEQINIALQLKESSTVHCWNVVFAAAVVLAKFTGAKHRRSKELDSFGVEQLWSSMSCSSETLAVPLFINVQNGWKGDSAPKRYA